MPKVYTKPQVTRVNLVPAEAVLGGCKFYMIMQYSGPDGVDGCCCGAATCKEQGS